MEGGICPLWNVILSGIDSTTRILKMSLDINKTLSLPARFIALAYVWKIFFWVTGYTSGQEPNASKGYKKSQEGLNDFINIFELQTLTIPINSFLSIGRLLNVGAASAYDDFLLPETSF